MWWNVCGRVWTREEERNLIAYNLKFAVEGKFVVISPQILYGLIEKVKDSPGNELFVDLVWLFPKAYQEYLVNVLNGNSDKAYFSYDYITEVPVKRKDLFRITERQFRKLKLEEENCFDAVKLAKKGGGGLELSSSNRFWTACKNREAVFRYIQPDGTPEILKNIL